MAYGAFMVEDLAASRQYASKIARALDYFVTYYIRAERFWTYFEYDCIQHIVYAVWFLSTNQLIDGINFYQK